LLLSAQTMRDAQTAALTDPGVAASEVTTDTDFPGQRPRPTSEWPSSRSIGGWLLTPANRQAVQAAAATGLALLAGFALTSSHQYWAALAAFLVLGGTSTVEETVAKGIERIAGTIIGSIIGFGVTNFTGANPFVVLPLLAVCIFAAMYMRSVSHAKMVFWLTMMLALLYEFLGTLTTETLQIRILETIIGAAIALAVAAFFLPIRTRQQVNSDGAALLKTLDGITQSCLKRLAGSSDIPSLTDQALTLDQQFQQLNNQAAPLRSASGALGTDGIERRITAAAALTYYARHLIRITEALAPGATALSAEAGMKLGTITRDNISTLIQVLNKEPPGPTHGDEDLPLRPDVPPGQREDGHTERDAVHYLVRINQTVLTLIKELTPDIAERTAT
jgi:uncharacterized membrane protein YccC